MTTIVVGTRTTMMTVVIMRVKILVLVVGTMTYNSSTSNTDDNNTNNNTHSIHRTKRNSTNKKNTDSTRDKSDNANLVIVVLGTVIIRTELDITMMVMMKIGIVVSDICCASLWCLHAGIIYA